ncbi:membrane protein [Haematobacter massiliensis]|uniref:Membrane protein n=1 Tax=Haematobacter massiliensis TaxID=195105 RepID=A0A086Y7R2_9RHOB|nr:membrane protein [Haematobacter massiliensis]
MMRLLPACLLLLTLLPLTADTQTRPTGERIVAGFSHDFIDISARFDGSEILVFGAVRREQAIPEDNPLGVIVIVEGPPETLTIRKKSHQFGIWMNTQNVRIRSAPSFYAVNTSWPVSFMLTPEQDRQYGISLPRLIYIAGRDVSEEEEPAFVDALIRIRRESGTYQINERAVSLEESTLFQTRVELPSTLVEGTYITRIYLTREGRVIDRYESHLPVYKVGVERWVHLLAVEQPLVTGLLALMVAVVAGWGASALFRSLRL